MKQLITFIENFINIFTVIGFQLAKGVNKILYAIIFSSFDQNKETLQIEKKLLNQEKKELENKKNSLEVEEKKYKEKLKEIEKLMSVKHISKKDFLSLKTKLKEKEKKLQNKQNKIVELQNKLTKNKLKEKIWNLRETKKDSTKSTEDPTYKEKIKELNSEIIRLEEEIKILESSKEFVGKPIQTKLKEIKKPTLKKTKNPLLAIKNYIRYRKRLNIFKKEVKEYLKIINQNKNSEKAKYTFESIKENSRNLELGDKLVRIYYLKDLPNFLVPTTLFKLINIPIQLTLSYHIEGTSKSAMIKAARERLSVLESLQNERLNKGKSQDHEIEKEINEVHNFIDNLVHDVEKVFKVSLYAVITADNKKELLQYDQKFQDETGDIEFTFNVYSFGQQKILPSTLPLAKDTVKEDKLLQTTAVGNLLPFLTRNLNDPQGIFLGTNYYSGSLILLDPFKARNANFNIFGTSGSGKSVTAKLLMTRLALRGVQNIILDPEGEYGQLAEQLGGEVIKFNRGNGLNPFYIGTSNPNSIKDHIAILKHFLSFFIQEERYDSAKLDKILMKTYEQIKTPNFQDFFEITKQEAKKDPTIDFTEDLKQLLSGSLSGLFDSQTSIRLNADTLVFDLSDLGADEKKIPAMYLLGSIIKRLVFKNKTDRRKMVWIDEAHKLLKNQQTVEFYVDLVKTARKYNTGVVSITQNPEDFKEENNAKAILTQAESSILLKQSPASINYIRNKGLFMLTEKELNNLPTLSIGDALFIREKEHIYINIIPFESEKRFVFT